MSQTSDLTSELLDAARTQFGVRKTKPLAEAIELATAAHGLQRRGTGEPYILHPVTVAHTLLEWHLDLPTVIAAILHDVPEDTEVPLEEIRSRFGDEVAGLVEAVTKLSAVRVPAEGIDYEAENLRRLFLAMAADVRVVLLKLADRLHNMQTLKGVEPRKRKRIARETLEIYAPLADRLGMGEVRSELDDLGFRYADPEQYEWTRRQVRQDQTKREQYIATVKREFTDALKLEGIDTQINARTKNLYSLYRKLLQKERDIANIYDLFAIRVIVGTVEECYQGMGVIHQRWQPLPHRIKDYIAVPKLNGYRSLHTTIFGPEDRLLEVQFRTREMHEEAELGIAAHAIYADEKEAVPAGGEQLAVVRQLASWKDELSEGVGYADRLKLDLFSKRVFVFTPKGAIHSLPADSTPVDFAYSVHSEIGNACVGSKVNGVLAPLDSVLENGDVVEIMTKRGASPKRDWLRFVRTGAARNNIRSWFRKEEREENVAAGKALMESILKAHGRTLKSLTAAEVEGLVGLGGGTKTLEDVCLRMGEGLLGQPAVLRVLGLSEVAQPVKKPKRKAAASARRPAGGRMTVTLAGGETVSTRQAQCCKPKPGDPIVGYVTIGRGISVHRDDCGQVSRVRDRSRIVPVTWKSQ